jgi:phage shock protein PspC (stress-responsive transcriptional regulator)
MKNELCARAESNVARYLTEGTSLDESVLAHMKDCGECAATLQRAQALGNLLENGAANSSAVVVDTNLSPVLTREVAAAVKRRLLVRAVLALAVIVVGYYFWVRIESGPGLNNPTAVWVIGMLFFTLPLLAAAKTAGVDVGPARVYKRIRGRQLSGVCQGLGESFAIPVWILRMAFIALTFLSGWTIVLYLILDVIMQIHPDDRSELLRFRIARWWKRRVEAI